MTRPLRRVVRRSAGAHASGLPSHPPDVLDSPWRYFDALGRRPTLADLIRLRGILIARWFAEDIGEPAAVTSDRLVRDLVALQSRPIRTRTRIYRARPGGLLRIVQYVEGVPRDDAYLNAARWAHTVAVADAAVSEIRAALQTPDPRPEGGYERYSEAVEAGDASENDF